MFRGLRLGLGFGICGMLLMVVAFGGAAFAQCAAPAQSGLALCFPSVGSTVLYPATLELAANSGGVQIAHVSVYDGSVKVGDFNFIPEKIVDGALQNGLHHVTVNAWDANGKLYQAKSSFTIIGFGQGSCAASSAAITLCSPSQASYVPEGSVQVSAAFGAGVKSWKMSIDGTSQLSSAQGLSTTGPLTANLQALAGHHTLTVSAVDSKGATSTVTREFSTFYNLDCSTRSGVCRPGIVITTPNDIGENIAGDESTDFVLQADVAGNPKPTTKMIVYMDGVKEEQSAGPGISATLKPAKGSHYVVIQAWDTTGNLYETYGNINVQ